MTLILIIALYLLFCLIAFSMMRTEQESEGEVYTKGDRALAIALSLLSILIVIWMLVLTWIKKISATGYWDRPVKIKLPNEPAENGKK